MKFKPYQLAHLVVPVSTRRRLVEVISYQIGEDTIMVRMVPGEPTTSIIVELDNLHRCAQNRYIHVARVTCRFSFPEDMLWYDNAALFDHTRDEQSSYRVPADGLLIYTGSGNKKKTPWTTDRWSSFSCTVVPILVRDLKDHSDYNTSKPKYK